MTAVLDRHDIQTVLCLAAHWSDLTEIAQRYTAHRMRLLYIAATKGWAAALYHDQQGTSEFLDVPPGFWSGFQPRTRAAQQTPQARGRQATRRARGQHK
jgi:hypothetical protein